MPQENQTTEEPIDSEIPIIDPHQHFWAGYFLDEFLADARAGHNTVGSVFVECMSGYRQEGPFEMRAVGETEFVWGLGQQAADSGVNVAAGIVGFADLTPGAAVDSVLAAHVAAGGGRFRAIRHASGWDASDAVGNGHTNPPERLLADATFREGFACLHNHGLGFDACLYHPQVPEVTDLARAFPETTIVLNHIGTPIGIGHYADRRDEVLADWKQSIAELATCENVYVKLGGVGMSIGGFGWDERDTPPTSADIAEAARPYYLYCIEQFGPDRSMFESNFPVDAAACTYTVLWNAFQRLAADFSAEEKAALFHDTAVRAYRLDV